MKQPPRQRPLKDERDQQIELQANSNALDFMIASTQILTLLCFLKGNAAWKGSFALLFIGGATKLFYQYHIYTEKPYLQVAIGLVLIGLLFFLWFTISG